MAALTLLFFAFALGGVAMAAFGTMQLVADRRLEARLTRVTGLARPERAALPLPSILSARGRDRREIEAKLRLAGFDQVHAVERFLWFRAAVTAAVALLMMLVSALAWGSLFARPWLVMIVAGLGYVAAKQMLTMAAAARTRRITAELPFLLDLMLMMLESGVSLDQCLRSIARDENGAAPLLTRSLTGLIADLDRGMSYDAALERWAARVSVSGATELAALFRQALFQGVELGPALRDMVREFTERRVAAAREAIGRITVQMIVVMILFFIPALFVVLGGPPLASMLDTLKGVK
jgi:tight adherence protein C